MSTENQFANLYGHLVRNVPDFPKPGIMFKDITPLLYSPQARVAAVSALKEHFLSQSIDAVAGIEARGFLFGVPLADALGVPFIPVRKAGKLPSVRISETYELEYGQATIEIHTDAVQKGNRILIHDDLLATGGTCLAAARLIKKLGGEPAGFSFLINLSFLDGADKIKSEFGTEPKWLIKY